ncbi:MAG TPA: PIG-L family deacetylase [Gordonia polyisoprenivorans]|uniref:PIG-L family deacetylase n=1 Tax=Gordonia polyisoprenivorans TaxID=84595 RepID=A0A846WJN5_9ACTN|nr:MULTISPECIES: PIG-L family deacetylase [Gordonia]MBE7194552.1 PIG-L family deacetylase [Gordonia polyisoprenivorans]MDF3283084.1 PIG-L family deacetylase [Gordonia sp. N1V]NKY01297.1 PIG-L family deacetylase [Gordonia polyisoprenivorans]OZC29732.1 PIG-L family deacetylase [Gordonia polyisoprenivorans]QUD81316.1 PIG-L family deacetylase [Gordonia polyisoprenivorans]
MGDATTTEQSTGDLADFPTRWHTGLALVAHPDDPEYGMSAAVARWVGEGKRIVYALASSGEKGIAGMDPDEAGPLREQEQREAASIVGVDEVEFWGFPDSDIANSEALRARITETIMAVDPDVIISLFGGDHWAPGAPNQRDHIEFAAAVVDAYDALLPRAHQRWLFENGPNASHAVEVGDEVEVAVRSLAAHRRYLEVLDPDTPVDEQARAQIEKVTAPREDFGGRRAVAFTLVRDGDTDPDH